jgi:hypothetical protein
MTKIKLMAAAAAVVAAAAVAEAVVVNMHEARVGQLV